MRRQTKSAIAPLLSCLLIASAKADLGIASFTIDSGGGLSSGAAYELNGTIGQADAGELANEQYQIVGGFWMPVAGCDEDVNRDGLVNLSDLSILVGSFGVDNAAREDGDIDSDGIVNLSDLSRLLAVFGTSCT